MPNDTPKKFINLYGGWLRLNLTRKLHYALESLYRVLPVEKHENNDHVKALLGALQYLQENKNLFVTHFNSRTLNEMLETRYMLKEYVLECQLKQVWDEFKKRPNDESRRRINSLQPKLNWNRKTIEKIQLALEEEEKETIEEEQARLSKNANHRYPLRKKKKKKKILPAFSSLSPDSPSSSSLYSPPPSSSDSLSSSLPSACSSSSLRGKKKQKIKKEVDSGDKFPTLRL